jgi:hypothetical protein
MASLIHLIENMPKSFAEEPVAFCGKQNVHVIVSSMVADDGRDTGLEADVRYGPLCPRCLRERSQMAVSR